MPSDDTLEHRLEDRVRALGGPFAVAYSGGADSALVLAAAVRVLGPERVLAVTAVSESLADGELSTPGASPTSSGSPISRRAHMSWRNPVTEPTVPTAATSASLRCWTPSPHLPTAGPRDGGHRHQCGRRRSPYRPGIRAGRERGIRTPLLDAGLTKADVRRLSRHWSLPTWNKPATPCLASRVRYGIEVTPYRLAASTAPRPPYEPCWPRPDCRSRTFGSATLETGPASGGSGLRNPDRGIALPR